MTSYVVGLCACLLIGGMGTYGFTVPADVVHKPPERIVASVVSHAVRTGVSGALGVPYVAVDDRPAYEPRHAAWLRQPVGICRHNGSGMVWKTNRDSRLDDFVEALASVA